MSFFSATNMMDSLLLALEISKFEPHIFNGLLLEANPSIYKLCKEYPELLQDPKLQPSRVLETSQTICEICDKIPESFTLLSDTLGTSQRVCKLCVLKPEATFDPNIINSEIFATSQSLCQFWFRKPEPIIVFLTDGLPNVHISNPDTIVTQVTNLNTRKSSIFSLAFGTGVNYNFLKKLSLRNSGFSRRIYEAADTTLQLTDFYDEISSPLLADVEFKYTPNQVCVILYNISNGHFQIE